VAMQVKENKGEKVVSVVERRGVKAGLCGENENISYEGKIVWSVVEEIRKEGCGGVVN